MKTVKGVNQSGCSPQGCVFAAKSHQQLEAVSSKGPCHSGHLLTSSSWLALPLPPRCGPAQTRRPTTPPSHQTPCAQSPAAKGVFVGRGSRDAQRRAQTRLARRAPVLCFNSSAPSPLPATPHPRAAASAGQGAKVQTSLRSLGRIQPWSKHSQTSRCRHAIGCACRRRRSPSPPTWLLAASCSRCSYLVTRCCAWSALRCAAFRSRSDLAASSCRAMAASTCHACCCLSKGQQRIMSTPPSTL